MYASPISDESACYFYCVCDCVQAVFLSAVFHGVFICLYFFVRISLASIESEEYLSRPHIFKGTFDVCLFF